MKHTPHIALIILAMASSGCSHWKANGPLFSQGATPSPGQALIYIYRPPHETFGWQRIYFVQANGNRLKDLKFGGYYPYETNPGHIQLDSATKQAFGHYIETAIERATVDDAKLEFDAVAGQAYYVKFHPESHPTYFKPRLFLMNNTDGDSEIKECKLLSE